MRRNRFDTSVEVLRSAKDESRFTDLYYRINCNTGVLSEILLDLEKKGLLNIKREVRPIKVGGRRLSKNPKKYIKKFFKTSEKGKLFLRKLDEALKIFGGLT